MTVRLSLSLSLSLSLCLTHPSAVSLLVCPAPWACLPITSKPRLRMCDVLHRAVCGFQCPVEARPTSGQSNLTKSASKNTPAATSSNTAFLGSSPRTECRSVQPFFACFRDFFQIFYMMFKYFSFFFGGGVKAVSDTMTPDKIVHIFVIWPTVCWRTWHCKLLLITMHIWILLILSCIIRLNDKKNKIPKTEN